MNNTATPKPLLPRWLIAFWLLLAIAVIALFSVEVLNDPGMSNTLQQLLLLLGLLVTLTWFAFRSRWSGKVRLLGTVGVLAAVGLFFTFFRLSGVSGALIPTFESRFGGGGWRGLEAPIAGAGAVDLETTSTFDFTGYLGPNRDLQVPAITLDRTRLSEPLEQLWRQPIGAGWGGFAVVNNYAATLEQRDDGDGARDRVPGAE